MSKCMKVGLVVLAFWMTSITLIFANKHLVGTKNTDQDISIFVSWFQACVCAAIVSIVTLGRHSCTKNPQKSLICKDIILSKGMLIASVYFVGATIFNNLCLKHVGVAFFQVAKSFTLIFTCLFSMVLLKKHLTCRAWLCCLMIACGFVLGIDQENLVGALSLSGVLYGLFSSIFVALVGIYTKKNLEMVSNDSLQLTLYMNLNTSLLFLPIVIVSKQGYTVIASDRFGDVWFWLLLSGAGILGAMMAWISAFQIHITSPVTHHISASTKGIVQTLIAVSYYREQKAILWWLSNMLVVGGAILYTYTHYMELQQKSRIRLNHSKSCADIENLGTDNSHVHFHENNNNVISNMLDLQCKRVNNYFSNGQLATNRKKSESDT
ncbi:unnamed protein product [Owenia fusiformis]|uniref:Uncharacterized protein n=1 Tax=Owenia fusiformis TaxID=6347 RepID=A0A8J1TPV9_OWEFU|nr:unnamed protein product [Owenia fusiformis]